MKVKAITLLSLAGMVTVATLCDAQEVVDRYGTPVDNSLTVRPIVRNANRASRIVGLRVRNYQNQELGRVEDVVFDFNTGRIAYVALSVPGIGGDHLVAVPPGAIVPATDGSNQLVMNIDPARLETAPSFARDNWPEVDRSFAGAEEFWGPTLNLRPGDRYYSSRNSDYYPRPPVTQTYRDEYRVDQGVAPRYQASTSTEQSRPYVTRSSFRGQVIAVDPETRTMSVESKTGEIRDFVFSDRPNLQLKNTRNPRIIDIKVGYPVIVGYREDPDGTLMAQTVIRTDTPEVK